MLVALVLAWISGLAMPCGALLARIERLGPGWLERELRHTIIAFGGGALISAVSLVLVPRGTELLQWSAACPLLLAGGVAFMAIDWWLARRGGSASQLVAMLADFIPEAIALGAIFAVDHAAGVLLAILIGFQNLPEGFNAHRELRASFRLAATRILVAFFLMSLLGPACAIAGYTLLQDRPAIIGGIMIFAAGGILYLTFEDIAPQARLEHRHAPPLGAVAGFLVGMLGHMLLGGV